jgi:WLM domain
MFPIVAAVSGVALAYALTQGPRNTIRMKGPDGHEYDMQNLPDKETAVSLLSEIRANLLKLQEYYKGTPALSQDPPVERFLSRFNPDVFVENDMKSDDTSYSENKGQKIVVCLRDKTNAPTYPLIDKNTIMFVILHEMAHLMTETIGHTQEFWANFKRILHDSVQVGIYTPVNYAQKPTPYCGMKITDSPL